MTNRLLASGIDNAYGLLMQLGVFRQLVLDGKTKQDKSALTARIVLGLQQNLHPKITTELVNKYFSRLPQGLQIAKPIDEVEEYEHSEPIVGTTITKVQSFGGADVKLARVESQIDRVADLFSQGKDQLGNQFLDELIDSQTRGTSDHSHVVKSLCNIATKCDVRGRRDISFACLSRARQYATGVDAILYLQIGNALRGIRKFEDAIVCYGRAFELDDGSLRDEIELDSIRLTIMRGDYQEALGKLSDRVGLVATILPPTTRKIGRLYRHLGDLRNARENYWKAISHDRDYHTAYAGLAEANKQSGRHFKAIERYQNIVRQFLNWMKEQQRSTTLHEVNCFELLTSQNWHFQYYQISIPISCWMLERAFAACQAVFARVGKLNLAKTLRTSKGL